MSEKLSIPKAAKLIGMSPSWLRSKCDAGEIRCTRPGKHRRVDKGDVLRLAEVESGLPQVERETEDLLTE